MLMGTIACTKGRHIVLCKTYCRWPNHFVRAKYCNEIGVDKIQMKYSRISQHWWPVILFRLDLVENIT